MAVACDNTGFFNWKSCSVRAAFWEKIRVLSQFYGYFDNYRNQRAPITKTFSLAYRTDAEHNINICNYTGSRAAHITYVLFYLFPCHYNNLDRAYFISGLGVRRRSICSLIWISWYKTWKWQLQCLLHGFCHLPSGAYRAFLLNILELKDEGQGYLSQ